MTEETLQMSMDIKKQEENGIRIEYYMLDGRRPEINMCPGDLVIICNVMHDYATLLESLVPEKEGYEQAMYEYHAGRCRKIQHKIEDAMNYSVEQAIAKCQKKKGKKNDDDIGEDAMVLAARMRRKKPEKANEIKQKTLGKQTKVETQNQINLFEAGLLED